RLLRRGGGGAAPHRAAGRALAALVLPLHGPAQPCPLPRLRGAGQRPRRPGLFERRHLDPPRHGSCDLMPSSPSSRLLLELQAPGENLNTWGEKLNNLFQMLEAAIRGRQALAVSGPVSLASANFALSPDTPIWLDLSGAGGTLTLPARESVRIVRNAGSGDMTLTTGAGEAAIIEPGALTLAVCDGINVRQLGFGGGSLKAYIDQELLAASAGELP